MKFKKTLILLLASTMVTTSCSGVPSKQEIIEKAQEKPSNKKNPLAYMKTNHGVMILELYRAAAPKTVENFIGLARGTKEYKDPKTNKMVTGHYYDGLNFHRIIPNFMIQGGDILGNGTGGPGYKFKDEINAIALGLDQLKLKDAPAYQINPHIKAVVFKRLNINSQQQLDAKKHLIEPEVNKVLQLSVKEFLETVGYQFNDQLPSVKNDKYTLSMANAGPNTNGSQFFINLVDNVHLNGKHTVFGKLIDGRDVLETIAKQVEPGQGSTPKAPVIIEKLRIIE